MNAMHARVHLKVQALIALHERYEEDPDALPLMYDPEQKRFYDCVG